ncbi:MAG: transposase family protein [Polaromonas sp.]|nr:transposase family protein [Polaromonas sp.]
MSKILHAVENTGFDLDQFGEIAVQRFLSQFDAEQSGQVLDPESQRIKLLEAENHQLRVDVDIWKTASVYFAHELRGMKQC